MNLYLAPMEGLTTFVYRNAYEKYYGGVTAYYSPFLANRTLNFKEVGDVSPEHNQGISLIPQILTNQADVFLEIAATLQDYGYKEVNLNLGCPSGTVAAKGRGAGFLDYPDKLDKFLNEIYEKCPLTISIKTRIGVDYLSEWEDLLKIYRKYPIKELIIHPRLQKEFYNGTPHRECFHLAQEMLECPLCYNGDITDKTSFDTLCEETNPFPSVMIGRGILRDPLLPAKLTGNEAPVKDYTIFKAFHEEILNGYSELMSGDQPVLHRMKELWFYMGSFVNASEKDLKKIRKATRMADYLAAVRGILQNAPQS